MPHRPRMHISLTDHIFAIRMDLQALLDRYQRDPRIGKLIANLQDSPPSRLHLRGVVGSLDALIGASTFLAAPRTHLFVLNDKEEAAYFLNDLQALLQKKDILFVPDSFKKPGDFSEQNSNNVLQRTEAINRLSNASEKSGELIVTYPEALFEKIADPSALKSQMILMKKGEKLDVDFTIDLLVEHGFEYADFVYEPGQFSVRGGIVDVFSYGNEWPYRVGLFGDEVESIKVFDPATQLSRKSVSKVTIVPNMQTQLEAGDKVALLECVPSSTVLWFRNIKHSADLIEHCSTKAAQISKALRDQKRIHDEHLLVKYRLDEIFTNAEEVLEKAGNFPIVEFGNTKNFDSGTEITFSSEAQPAFNKQFDLLIETLGRQQSNGYTNLLFASNPRQIERFYQIFEDLKAELEYHPLPLALSKGFIDLEQKVACFTDHQIFERYHKYAIRRGYSKSEALTIKALRELKPGDFVTHIDHGVGVYSSL